MARKITPKYIFETSWEVCNMVGGIYTVLSTRARTLSKKLQDNLLFIGPDVWQSQPSPYFEEDQEVLSNWVIHFNQTTNLNIRAGRWKIHGNPIAILVDFKPLMESKNDIYGEIWEKFGVDSIHAYGDYDESSMFGYATGIVMESYYNYFQLKKTDNVVAHFNEWMTTFGAFYLQDKVPNIATIFTTHATSIGRSIAGNQKPLYNYLSEYNGNQMAYELNMQSKHSTERTAAHVVDCFTTVSGITGLECTELLDKKPDIITPNGFEDDFVPKGKVYKEKQKQAREKIIEIAETLFGCPLSKDALFIGTAGRYEYKNKGLDVFIESLKKLSESPTLEREVVAFLMIPAHIKGARKDLIQKLNDQNHQLDYWDKYTTHELFDQQNDNILSALRWFHLLNNKNDKVKVVFVPSYLNGNDGIFNISYWDLLIGLDATIFPSYYEPWGYTPLESIAFSIPTITTDLSGFGQWIESDFSNPKGVHVVHRSDYNYYEVSDSIAQKLLQLTQQSKKEQEICRKSALEISQNAHWEKFIVHYYDAYHIALQKRNKRIKK